MVYEQLSAKVKAVDIKHNKMCIFSKQKCIWMFLVSFQQGISTVLRKTAWILRQIKRVKSKSSGPETTKASAQRFARLCGQLKTNHSYMQNTCLVFERRASSAAAVRRT